MSKLLSAPLALAACGSPQPVPSSAAIVPAATSAETTVDAGVDALPAAVTNAAPWVFCYRTADRAETWTLRHADGVALLVVEAAAGERRYVGTATDTETTLAVDVATTGAKMALECKREKLAVSATCNDRKAPSIDVLSCYHADFKTPMPFGPAPGIEYVVDATCNGYRVPAP